MTARGRILLVDDETSIQRAVAPLLRSRGYDVEVAGTGVEALRVVSDRAPDVIVLDLGLPDIEGTEVCRRIRETMKTPIIVLSARGAEADKVNALDLGADDYVTKPFSTRELMAHIKALLRRVEFDSAHVNKKNLIVVNDLKIDLDRRQVSKGDKKLKLRYKEFELLSLLVNNAGEVVTRADIFDKVWGTDWLGDMRTLEVHIRWLREKLEDEPGNPRYIQTVRSVGYRFVIDQ